MSELEMRYETRIRVKIDLKDVEEYLLKHGWKDIGPFGPRGRCFESEEYAEVVHLVSDDKVADFRLRMSELIHELERLEKRSVPDILSDMGATTLWHD